MIVMIAAAAENNALGKDNKLLWHLPDDFKRFRQLTTGHHIIMGRKTFESFPKPLPDRTHIVITRQKEYAAAGCIIVDGIEKALAVLPENQGSFVIGGGEIYALALPFADKIELTRIHASFDADAFFPNPDSREWKIESEIFHQKDERHQFEFTYQTYVRR